MTYGEIMELFDPVFLLLGLTAVCSVITGIITIEARDVHKSHEDLVLRIMRSAAPSVGMTHSRMTHLCGTIDGLSSVVITRTLDRLVQRRILRREEDAQRNYVYRFRERDGASLRSSS